MIFYFQNHIKKIFVYNIMKMEKPQINENSEKIKYNNRYMENITTIELIENSKRPYPNISWKNPKNQTPNTNIYKFNPNKEGYNLGIPTGKINNITVIDLDFYDKDDNIFDLKNSSFIKNFGYNYIEDFDTFTVKTPSGGIHLYFKYDEEIGQTQNDEHKVDTRNNGGYVVSPNSKRNNLNYKIINDTNYKNIPDDLKQYLLNVILNKNKPKKKPKKKKEINKTDNKNEEVIEDAGYYHLDKFTYNFSDDLLIKIIEGLPEKYFNTYQGWLIFTTAMKQINRKDLWIKYSKKSSKYNETQNNIQWDGIKRHIEYNCFSNLLLNTKVKNARTMLEYYMYIDYDVHETKPDVIINQPKLTDENYSNFLDEKCFGKDFTKSSYDCLIMKSDTGTGKTTSFRKYYGNQNKGNTNFLSIVSRVSLAEEQYVTFLKDGIDCQFYKNVNKMYEKNNYIITIDSIIKFADWDIKKFKNYVIYLDEFNSMIEYLICADTLNNRRVIVFKQLLDILNNCKKIICTDADINDISLSFLKLVNKNKIYIKNEFLHNKNIKCQELFSYGDFCQKLHLEKKFLCCCDSKSQAEMIHQQLIDFGVRDVKLITSDTDDKYINLDEHDKVIYSPKIIYGLDSSIKRPVYCYYKERTIAPTAMIQQIARCRNIQYLRYTFEMKKVKIEDEEFSLDFIEKELNKLDSFGFDFCSFKILDTSNVFSSSYLELYTKYKYLNRCYETNKFGHFLNLLEKRGFKNDSIKFYNTNLDGTKNMRDKVKELKLENFSVDHPSVIKINEYLNIDEQSIEEYKDYFLNQRKLDNHFNISTYFFKNDENTINKKLQEKLEFDVKKVSSNLSKMKFLQEIKVLSGCHDNNDIIVKNPLDITKADFYATNYNKVWNASIKKSDIDFTDIDVIKQYLYKMYKNLFGNELVKNDKIMVNNKRKTKYTFDNKILEREETLYNFRKRSTQNRQK